MKKMYWTVDPGKYLNRKTKNFRRKQSIAKLLSKTHKIPE